MPLCEESSDGGKEPDVRGASLSIAFTDGFNVQKIQIDGSVPNLRGLEHG